MATCVLAIDFIKTFGYLSSYNEWANVLVLGEVDNDFIGLYLHSHVCV